jgi:NADH:ubiquinone oxidoreductase subunit F (NADH-binding)
MVRGEGETRDLDLLKELAEAMKVSSSCDLGRNAANQVLSSLRLFSREYDIHIKEKKCPYKS